MQSEGWENVGYIMVDDETIANTSRGKAKKESSSLATVN
jgi:hypothetical protein